MTNQKKNKMPRFVEKRKFPRIKTAIPLRYKELHGNTYLAKGALTRNLSGGGVKFVSNGFIALACHLMFEIQLPSISNPIKAISKPVWVRKMRHGDNYEIGSQFLALTSEDASVLSDFTKSFSQK